MTSRGTSRERSVVPHSIPRALYQQGAFLSLLPQTVEVEALVCFYNSWLRVCCFRDSAGWTPGSRWTYDFVCWLRESSALLSVIPADPAKREPGAHVRREKIKCCVYTLPHRDAKCVFACMV
ncbi:hypothetical protein BaRGS_00003180 [Batillaria attramentaria]|uniref:Uncharacterized protein n=1 Tax=Batillaria attramentaria TaxID=370345 RepID=A0ABD0M0W0_9CAEN